jgi:Heparinase II/III-like protein/Heparinase II/III N-terminus
MGGSDHAELPEARGRLAEIVTQPVLLRVAQALRRPPRLVAARILNRLERVPREWRQRRLDRRLPTYLLDSQPRSLTTRLALPDRASLAPHREALLALARGSLAHEFDLLGSGPVVVRHGMLCVGLGRHRFPPGPKTGAVKGGAWLESIVNQANLREARRIGALVDDGYIPIDWQIDFKSGFRWSAQTWYRDISVYGNPLGADIKLPWELARCQHLPQLALAYSVARGSDPGSESWAREFRNQVLDFVAANPPRYGVNWACTMDVAIRAANWVVAYDLFRAGGASFDPDFDALIARSILEHARHVSTNLEWTPGLRGNHYLADICGLLFAAAYLPSDEDTDAWLALALQELVREAHEQFHPDGGNVEASTSYHRLAGEMVVYSFALALGLPQERLAGLRRVRRRSFPNGVLLEGPPVLPDSLGQRIARMADFTRDITLPNGLIAQFGDNDSGRFFKLPGSYRRLDANGARRYRVPDLSGVKGDYWDEEVLDHRHFVAAADGLLGINDAGGPARGREIDAEIVRLLSRGRAAAAASTNGSSATGSDDAFEAILLRIRSLPEGCRQRYEFAGEGRGLCDGLRTAAYPQFGLYVARSERLYLAIRCGRLHPQGSGAHAHNDQLAIELWIDGKALVTDPGTWVYTPLPEERNRYRSALAHFAPRVAGREPSRIDAGLFFMPDSARARCLYFGSRGFAGEHFGFGEPVLRAITFQGTSVVVEDGSLGEPLERLESLLPLAVSNKYGCQLA